MLRGSRPRHPRRTGHSGSRYPSARTAASMLPKSHRPYTHQRGPLLREDILAYSPARPRPSRLLETNTRGAGHPRLQPGRVVRLPLPEGQPFRPQATAATAHAMHLDPQPHRPGRPRQIPRPPAPSSRGSLAPRSHSPNTRSAAPQRSAESTASACWCVRQVSTQRSHSRAGAEISSGIGSLLSVMASHVRSSIKYGADAPHFLSTGLFPADGPRRSRLTPVASFDPISIFLDHRKSPGPPSPVV
jgi:hypothetical protein